jgi:hypothetical protein
MTRSVEPLRRALRALAWANALLGTLVAAIVVGALYLAFFFEPQLPPEYTAELADEVNERLAANSDAILDEARGLAAETLPPLSDALYEQARRDYPAYLQAFENQGGKFREEVERIFIAKVKARYRDYLRRHVEVLREEFPEHASEENIERIMREFERTTDEIVQRYYLAQFREETERTVDLWKKIPPLDRPGPGEPSLELQLANSASDWAVLSFAGEDVGIDDAPSDEPSRDAPADPPSARPDEP